MVPAVSTTDLLGTRVTRQVLRLTSAGAFVAVDPKFVAAGDPSLLVPGRELPPGTIVGTSLEICVYLDGEQRPIATTRTPHVLRDQVAFLTVTDVTSIGAFVDWGLGKELLVPFAEQTKDLVVGERQPIAMYLDKSFRLAGSMNIRTFLREPPALTLDAWVTGEAWRNEPGIGLFVIVDQQWVGLVPAAEPHQARRGDVLNCRIASIRPDGKVVLSLRQHAHLEAGADAERILAALDAPRATPISERASPDELRDRFGLSRKAFKRAVGRLLRERAIDIDDNGTLIRVPPRG